MRGEDIAKEKVSIYFKQDRPIHIKLKDGEWLNGHVKEMSADFFMLEEFKRGETPIFFLEVVSVNPFTPKGEGNGASG